MSNYLFGGLPVFDLSRQIQSRASTTLKALNESAILVRSTDDIISELLEKFELAIPELRDSDTSVDESETEHAIPNRGYDIYLDRNFGTRTVITHTVNFHVPFDGDANLFNVAPSRRSLPGPESHVNGNELVISISTDNTTKERIQASYNQRIQSIKEHLANLRNDLSALPRAIESEARTYIEQRKADLLKSKNLVASLGFPMKRRDVAQMTYRAPEVTRKIVPAKARASAPFKPEPVLDEAEYQHILGVMDNMTKVMERSPHTFVSMGEEDIRQHFLVQLNGQYEGQATGETFNFNGKTDILIRSGDRNIFVAECKFWRGEKSLLEAVDQLLSYLSWRDSKTAVVIFNKNRDLSNVLKSIKEAMEKHPHMKRGPTKESETRFRYVMGNPNDHDREIIMTVMVYDMPMAN